MNARSVREGVVPFTIGLVTAVLLQLGGWWLNSSRGVVTTLVVLFVAAAGLCLRPERPWQRATAMTMGSITGMTVALFWVGPGTIWPIVLVVAAALTGAAVFGGAAAARALRPRR